VTDDATVVEVGATNQRRRDPARGRLSVSARCRRLSRRSVTPRARRCLRIDPIRPNKAVSPAKAGMTGWMDER
jgi:hypothetical protein